MRIVRRLFRRRYSCQEVMEVLQAYLDGEVDDAAAREVAGHLDGCSPCGHESHVYERIKISLHLRRRDYDDEVLRALRDYARRVARDGAG